MRQVHKVVLMVVDFDDLGEEGIIQQLESARRLPASVREIDTRDIDWDDSHPLNSETHWREKFDELFGNAPAVVEQVDALTDERMMALWCALPSAGSSDGDAIAFARAVIAATRQAAPVQAAPEGWQSIETAPKDGINVLLINRKGNMAAGLWQVGPFRELCGWWLRGGNAPDVFFNDHHGPTHWMPLPAAPAPGGAK